MGRIEEALAKLQAQRASSGERAGGPEAKRVIGTVREPASADHNYGGKYVEIEYDELRARGLLAPNNQEQLLADEYRAIKRPLLKNASTLGEPILPRANLLMVASALGGEGKTFTSINLCLSIAREQDWSVVLIDGDCHKPHLTRLFGAEGELGLMDLLRDPAKSFDSLVMPTGVERFSLLPAGSRHDRAAELLASRRMETMCAEISKADPRRMIIFDSAPLLLRPESQVLAGQVGQVVLVVRANKTPRRAVLTACDRLDPSKSINLLLNQVAGHDGVAGYGEYYGYAD